MNSSPYVNESGNLHRVTGFGDTILATLISPSPKLAGPWLLGAGPSFIFPTASNSRLGQNKWQIGPAGVLGYLGDKWLGGVFPQQWFSVGGPGSQTTSQMNIQYFFVYLPGDGWGIGTSPNILVNWYANKSANMVTFPVGLNVSKVIKAGPLPVKLQVQGQYMPVHPEVFGQKWNLQFSITPVIPKLIKGPLSAAENVKLDSVGAKRASNIYSSQSYISRHTDSAGIRHVCARRRPGAVRNGCARSRHRERRTSRDGCGRFDRGCQSCRDDSTRPNATARSVRRTASID